MKGKIPTRVQKKIIASHGLDPSEWLVLKNPTTGLVIKHRETGKIEEIPML